MIRKRGQEMSTNTIILIVLGLIILVVLALGFILGWDKIIPFLNSNNVDNVKSACDTACVSNNKYDYCQFARTLKDPEQKTEVKLSCNLFTDLIIPANAEKNLLEISFNRYPITNCASITCDNKPKCTDLAIKLDNKKYKIEEKDTSVCTDGNGRIIDTEYVTVSNPTKVCCITNTTA